MVRPSSPLQPKKPVSFKGSSQESEKPVKKEFSPEWQTRIDNSKKGRLMASMVALIGAALFAGSLPINNAVCTVAENHQLKTNPEQTITYCPPELSIATFLTTLFGGMAMVAGGGIAALGKQCELNDLNDGLEPRTYTASDYSSYNTSSDPGLTDQDLIRAAQAGLATYNMLQDKQNGQPTGNDMAYIASKIAGVDNPAVDAAYILSELAENQQHNN